MLSPARLGGSRRQSSKTISITAAALALRFALVAVASLVDAYKPFGLRYTDVDYDVLKDGARAMMQGDSPFQRATYRYSPLVSYPLLLDLKTGLPLAKVVFCLMDVLLGDAIGDLASRRGASYHVRLLWLFNPISIVLCTRGSWDAVSVYLVLQALLSKRSPVKAGLLLGFATHLRLYPVIYAAPFLYNLCFEERRRLPWIRALTFSLAFASGLLAPTLCAYHSYGQVYVEEALLYHLRRADHRHSFSVFWLPIYLSRAVRGPGSGPAWKSTSELGYRGDLRQPERHRADAGMEATSRRWRRSSTPSSRCSHGDNVAAWSARHSISTQAGAFTQGRALRGSCPTAGRLPDSLEARH